MQMEEPNTEVIAMPGLRTRMAAYQQNTTHKKKHGATSKRDKTKKVGKLKEELRDPGLFESSGVEKKSTKPVFTVAADVEAHVALAAQQDPGSLQNEPPRQPTGNSPTRRKKPAVTQDAAQPPSEAAKPEQHDGLRSNLTKDVQSSRSLDSENDCSRNMFAAISRNHGNHEREIVAKNRLNVLLQREMKDAKVAHNYASCRVRYLRAVGNLRPSDYYASDMNDSFSMEDVGLPSPDLRARRRDKRKTEKEKKGRYDELKETWHSYDDVALDKPMEPSPEEKELENDLDEIEDEIHEEWEDFTQDVIATAEEEKEAGVEDEDPDIEEWRREQQKLKEDAVNRKRRKVEREKKRQAFMEEKRRELESRQKEENERKEKESGSNPAETDPEADKAQQKATDEPENDHDADNEQEKSPHNKDRKRGKHKKKRHPKHEKQEKQPQEHGEQLKMGAVVNPEPTETVKPPETPVEVTETEQPLETELPPENTEPIVSDDQPSAEGENDVEESGDDGSQTQSLGMRTDAAWKKRGKSGPLGQLKFLGQEDEEEEEDILPAADPAQEIDEKDRKPRRPMREKSLDMTEGLPVGLPNSQGLSPQQQLQALAQQPRKKKELRIEYDNGIPKEVTLIINRNADDESYSSPSGSESDSESSSSSESSEDIEDMLPVKRTVSKKLEKGESVKKIETSPTKTKHDVLRIDTLPAQQFYDGTEESPFIAWTHRPLKSKVDGSQIVVKVPPRSDCWRKTRHNFIMDNAPFYWHRVTGDFEVMVKVSGDMKKMYDKAGIMIRLDAENWICSGLEFFNNELNHMTCVTRDYTDWSMAPVAPEAKTQGAWICVKRIGDAYESFVSLDGRNWRQARQGIFTNAKSVRVGIFCACPMGESYKVTFDKYRCKNLNI